MSQIKIEDIGEYIQQTIASCLGLKTSKKLCVRVYIKPNMVRYVVSDFKDYNRMVGSIDKAIEIYNKMEVWGW